MPEVGTSPGAVPARGLPAIAAVRLPMAGAAGFLTPGSLAWHSPARSGADKGAPQPVRGTVGGPTEPARSPAQKPSRFSFHADIVRGALVVLKT